MFKKSMLAAVCLALVLISAACSGISTPGTASSSDPVTQGSSTNSADLSVQEKMGIGILKLEGTTLAVTAEQANTLLPLWKTLKSLSTSDTSSAAEISALYQQMEETLTSEQVQAIQQLTWTSADLNNLLQQYGIQADQASMKSTQALSQSGGASDPGGVMPGGEVMAGMDPGAQGSQIQQTPQPAQRSGNSVKELNLMLADPVITLLNNKA